ncbi:hypothetical protein [Alkalihalobacterium chitinilyticum]|uniref:Uncharacterized protein n=1 Tax=Alkalihalobacterium chitinilyticum TaxID=2980103 RepID=A0ABT5VF92_9BACI|nr:hypothetical protein [Alkalihalobacterium chitinilyticum]MDE5414125.1 hypothetical protein [Alkalihalobacterium chitinilyticum]
MSNKNLQKCVEDFVEARLESILTSTEYEMYIETLYKELEEKMFEMTKEESEEEIRSKLDEIKSNIYEQIFAQNKATYKYAVRDTMSLMINNYIVPKKFE